MSILLQAYAEYILWKMELAHHDHVVWWNKKMGLSAFRTPERHTISIHDQGLYKAYRDRKEAIRTLDGF